MVQQIPHNQLRVDHHSGSLRNPPHKEPSRMKELYFRKNGLYQLCKSQAILAFQASMR